MIPFEPVPEPADFNAAATVPGAAWLAANPIGRPKDYWSPFRDRLAGGFKDLCAYTAMITPVGTVDHFISCDEDRTKAYDWANYRYAAAWVNASKQNLRSTNLLDPFEVKDGWFKIILPSLQLVVAEALPPELRAKAEYVLKRLRLRDDERVVRQRRAWYRMYQDGELTLSGLRKVAPLIARAVEDGHDGSATGGE